uniref:Uncharacterized protein n=1 Tax=Methylophaga nitratireducenticrescens TaxID=754476 RepID=I1XLX9_METNJ
MFLSCLFGSEQVMAEHGQSDKFLSCLFGSERCGYGGYQDL